MTQLRHWWRPCLVLTVDLLWSLILDKLGQPLFMGLFPGQAQDANRLLESQLMPMLWISYVIVLGAQIGWLAWASRHERRRRHHLPIEVQLRRLRRTWWGCALGQLALSTGVQLMLAVRIGGVNSAGLGFVLALLLCDLVVIYWLPTALLVPADLRRAIPGAGCLQRLEGMTGTNL